MKKIVLPNGLTVIFEAKKGNAVVVEAMIKVGSNDETPSERGITHFIEHMAFEGTVARPNNKLISNEIERIGGEFNAYTTNERTCFYIKVLQKHFPIAVKVLADILQNPLFKEEHIQKEKNVVLKEIDMVFDDPRFYQWVLLQSTLFHKNPARYPTFGDKEVIKTLTRNKIWAFFRKYYTPSNIILLIVGDVSNWKEEIQAAFTSTGHTLPSKKIKLEPLPRRNYGKLEQKKITNTYTVLGFPTVPKSHSDMYPLEVINGILGRGQSGWIFTEIRSKLGLAYEVGTQNVHETSFGYFSVYASIDRKNIPTVKNLILQEVRKVQNATEDDVREAKEYIEGAYLLELEDPQKVADYLLSWEQSKDAKSMKEFIANIKSVTLKDVQRVARRYFQHYTFVVLEGK